MSSDQRIGSAFPVVHYGPFSLANLADSQDGTAIPYDTNGDDTAPMPADGHIVAISARLNAALTAGTITIKPTVDGTEDTDGSTVISGTEQTETESDFVNGLVEFDEGERLGTVYDSDADVEPNTVDIVVDVYVVFDLNDAL